MFIVGQVAQLPDAKRKKSATSKVSCQVAAQPDLQNSSHIGISTANSSQKRSGRQQEVVWANKSANAAPGVPSRAKIAQRPLQC